MMWLLWLLFAWLVCAMTMLLAFGVYLLSRQVASADLFWGPGIGLVGWLLLSSHSITLSHVMIMMLVTLWAIRLSSFLWWTRFRVQKEEKRFDGILQNWGPSARFNVFKQYQLQALLQAVVAMPVIVLPMNEVLLWPFIIGFGVALCALVGEGVADRQLHQFIKDQPRGSLAVCRSGLWRYSRHPNCFFDWLFWCGIAMTCWGHDAFGLALLGPLVLWYVFRFITIPITEHTSCLKRPDYKKYQQQVSCFVPYMKTPNA